MTWKLGENTSNVKGGLYVHNLLRRLFTPADIAVSCKFIDSVYDSYSMTTMLCHSGFWPAIMYNGESQKVSANVIF